MVKAPRPGLAKTRLVQSGLGATSAARIAQALLQDCLDAAHRVGVPLALAYTPTEERAFFQAAAPGAMLWEQGEGDLGQRLQRATSRAFERGAQQVVVIGTDAPDLGTPQIAEAFTELEQHSVVIGPARDGGYTLIGMRSPHPELFVDIAWSSPLVLKQTLERAPHAKLLPELIDIDTRADWEEVRARAGGGPHLRALSVE